MEERVEERPVHAIEYRIGIRSRARGQEDKRTDDDDDTVARCWRVLNKALRAMILKCNIPRHNNNKNSNNNNNNNKRRLHLRGWRRDATVVQAQVQVQLAYTICEQRYEQQQQH